VHKIKYCMKQSLLPIYTLVLFFSQLQYSSAQFSFKVEPTTYVGALDGTTANDWTKNWTNWNPKNTAYPAPSDTITLNGMVSSLPIPGEKNITSTVTLDATQTYLLKGLVVVRTGGKLVIPAGTVIRAIADVNSTPKNYASILVERGGKIEVLGTETSPVVITSAKAVGARERGDWGGLVIAGKAKHNLLNGTDNNNVQMEGFNNVTFDATLARFGGTDVADNSGIVRYLRLEFGGLAFETNKEINGLTLGAVGTATEIHHIQISYSNDDSYEWFGGSVKSHHLIAYKGTDDDFDTDNGYDGISQFGIAVRDSAYFDGTYSLTSGSSTSEGFESDNEATGTAAIAPYTRGIFTNYTMVGPVEVGGTYASMNSVARAAFRRGARIRRNSSLSVCNSIFMGYRNFLMIDGDSSIRNTNNAALLALVTPSTPVSDEKRIFFSNNVIVNTAAAFTSTTDTTANGLAEVARAAGSLGKLTALDAWIKATGPLANHINPVAFTTGTLLVNPLASSTTPDFRPVVGSPALAGANFLNNPKLVNLLTASKEIEVALISPVYPNPISSGMVNFGKEVESYGIFDLKGNLVRFGFNASQAEITGLTTGMYIIKLDGRAQKLIVE
jgi:hypothetical protein